MPSGSGGSSGLIRADERGEMEESREPKDERDKRVGVLGMRE